MGPFPRITGFVQHDVNLLRWLVPRQRRIHMTNGGWGAKPARTSLVLDCRRIRAVAYAPPSDTGIKVRFGTSTSGSKSRTTRSIRLWPTAPRSVSSCGWNQIGDKAHYSEGYSGSAKTITGAPQIPHFIVALRRDLSGRSTPGTYIRRSAIVLTLEFSTARAKMASGSVATTQA